MVGRRDEHGSRVTLRETDPYITPPRPRVYAAFEPRCCNVGALICMPRIFDSARTNGRGSWNTWQSMLYPLR